MYVLMFIISFCLAADAAVLIISPQIYRRSLEYINESIGPVWGVLYGMLFSFCAIFVLISIVLSGVSIFYILPSIAMAFFALFFLMTGTQKYGHFADIWTSLSDIQYRIAGVIFIILAAVVCYIAAYIR